MRALLTAALILIAGLGIWSAACAGLPYSADVVAARGAAADTWLYTVSNTSTLPQYVLWIVAIEVDDQIDVSSVVTPYGWTADIDSQPHFITWMYMAGELEAGETQSGFEACFSGTPALQTYTALFDNSETGEAPCADGIVRTAPEPTGVAVLLTGLAPVAAFALRRRLRG